MISASRCTTVMATALLCITVAVMPAAAQDPPDVEEEASDADIQASTCGWHFLDDEPQPPTVRALAARATPHAREIAAAVAGLQRWYLECNATSARVAAQSLNRMQRIGRSRDPVVRGMHAIALVRGPWVQISNATGVLVRPARFISNSERDGVRLLTALFDETRWPELATELIETGFTTRKAETLRAAQRVLRSAAAETDSPQFWADLAEVELLLREYPAAEAAARRAAELGDRRGLRALGTALLLSGDAAQGGAHYLEGLDGATGALLHRYFDDIRGLLGDDELEQWEALAPGARAAWIRTRWEWRALLAGVTVGERLAEHHRRLEHVMRTFARQSYRGAEPVTSIRISVSRSGLPFDDRGIIYLRHGPPDDELRMAPPAMRTAWGYRGLGGTRRIFEFDRSTTRADWFLAEPISTCQNVNVVTLGRPLSGTPRVRFLDEWVARVHTYDPSLAMYYRACENRPVEELSGLYQEKRAEAVRNALEAWRTETALPRHRRPLNVALNLYTFRGGAATELVGYVAVDAAGLASSSTAAGEDYALRVLFGVGEPLSDRVLRVDTTMSLTTRAPLPEQARLGMALALAPGAMTNARVTASLLNLHDAGQGQVLASSRAIPDYRSAALALSDLVVAEDRDGTWRRGAHALAPAPGHVVAEGSTFRLYYELYGARAGDPLRVTMTVAPGREPSILARLRSLVERRSAMSLVFREEVAGEGVIATQRNVTAAVEPGAYVLIVNVVNERTGEAAESQTPLIVLRR